MIDMNRFAILLLFTSCNLPTYDLYVFDYTGTDWSQLYYRPDGDPHKQPVPFTERAEELRNLVIDRTLHKLAGLTTFQLQSAPPTRIEIGVGDAGKYPDANHILLTTSPPPAGFEHVFALADFVDHGNMRHNQRISIYLRQFWTYLNDQLTVPEWGEAIANVAAHEIGHTLGHEHTDDPAKVSPANVSGILAAQYDVMRVFKGTEYHYDKATRFCWPQQTKTGPLGLEFNAIDELDPAQFKGATSARRAGRAFCAVGRK